MNEQSGVGAGREENAEQNLTGEQQAQQRDQYRRGGSGGRNRNRNQPRQGGQPQQQTRSSLNMNELRELAELINQHGFTDFEFENENIRVRLRKELAPQIIHSVAAPPPSASFQTSAPVAAATPQQSVTAEQNTAPADEDANLQKVVSPIVGTFYRAPSPEADPFVKVGSQITADTIVCIVEAMKLMNEIPAEISGEIVKIYVENGQPVEYGQPLFAVK